jgi:DNA polymerase-3 subunit delta
VSQLHLVLGDEDLLVVRAIADVLRTARKQAGTHDVPVDRMRAGEVSTNELAAHLPPGAKIAAQCGDVGAACRAARAAAKPGERIVVFGSFLTVGPALEFLGPEVVRL